MSNLVDPSFVPIDNNCETFELAMTTTLNSAQEFSIVDIYNGDLDQRYLLREFAIISIFSWARAQGGDQLPDESGERMGWWGTQIGPGPNGQFGSKLWLLRRSKLTQQTVNFIRDYLLESLQWMVNERLCTDVSVDVLRNGDRVEADVTITRGPEDSFAIRFSDLWSAIQE